MSSSSERRPAAGRGTGRGFVAGLPTYGAEGRSAVLDADEVGDIAGLETPELRTGHWTRHGDRSLLGDPVTETVLGEVAVAAKAAAQAQGYAVGWAQGRREARAEAAVVAAEAEQERQAAEARREAEHRAAMLTLADAAEQVRDMLAGLCNRVETQATELAWAVTEALIGREVRSVEGPDVVRRVLSVLPAGPLCTVRLHPDVARSSAVADLYDRGVEVVADPTLDRADALVYAEGGVVDLRVSGALERVREVLT